MMTMDGQEKLHYCEKGAQRIEERTYEKNKQIKKSVFITHNLADDGIYWLWSE